MPGYLQLNRGHRAIVDAARLKELSQWKWSSTYKRDGSPRYVGRTWKEGGRTRYLALHRYLLGLRPGDGKIVDHINNNTLDNRLCNLRLVSHQQNNSKRRTTSRFGWGVKYCEGLARPYMVRVTIDGVRQYLGLFASPEEAVAVRDRRLAKKKGKA